MRKKPPLLCRLFGHSWIASYPGGIYGSRILSCRRRRCPARRLARRQP